MKTVTITWAAFGRPTSTSFEVNDEANDANICEAVFADTNLYQGPVWDKIKDALPEGRTHTALSVGDTVRIADVTYVCENFGWSALTSTN